MGKIAAYNMTQYRNFAPESSRNLAYKLLMYLVWPFGTWLYSLKSANTYSSYVIFFLFSLLLCWHMSPAGLTETYDDFLGILDSFKEFQIIDTWDQIIAYFSLADDAPKEIYEILLMWFSKTFFGENYHFYFLLASIPVALCQLRSMSYLTKDEKYVSGSLLSFFVVAMFIFPRDIITVQNPRFATGFWINVMATLGFFLGKHKLRYALLILCTPMIHSGFWGYVILFFLGFLIVKFPIRKLETILLLSLPFVFFNANLLDGVNLDFDFLPNTLNHWIQGYTSDESYAEHILHEGKAGFWWVGAFFDIALRVVYMLMMIQIVKQQRAQSSDLNHSLYSFLLGLFICVNMMQFLPVVGERYYWFTRVFCIFLWFKVVYPNHSRTLLGLVVVCSWFMLHRYGYVFGGALACNTPPDIFCMPLPYLIGKGLFW